MTFLVCYILSIIRKTDFPESESFICIGISPWDLKLYAQIASQGNNWIIFRLKHTNS
jgi:hypothetical protein